MTAGHSPFHYYIPPGPHIWIGVQGAVCQWRRQADGKGYGPTEIQVGGGAAVIELRSGFHAIYAPSQFYDIQVHFQDPLLPPYLFDQASPVRLQPLPQKGSRTEGKDILCRLLGQGAASTEPGSFFPVQPPHCLQSLPVKAPVLIEKLVLTNDDGLDEFRRYILQGHPFLFCPVISFTSELKCTL